MFNYILIYKLIFNKIQLKYLYLSEINIYLRWVLFSLILICSVHILCWSSRTLTDLLIFDIRFRFFLHWLLNCMLWFDFRLQFLFWNKMLLILRNDTKIYQLMDLLLNFDLIFTPSGIFWILGLLISCLVS